MIATIDSRAFFEQLHTLGASLRNNATQALKAAVQTAEADARATTLYNDRTGALRKNTFGSVDGLEGKLVAKTKYARFVESGTAPHVIEGRRGGMLRFVMNGEVIFRRRVNHPGTQPRPFMEHASQVGEQTLDYGLEYFTDFAIQKFNTAGG